MKAPPLESMMQTAYSSASKIIAGGEEAQPVFLAEMGDGGVYVYMAAWRDHDEKVAITSALRLIFAARKVKRYVFVAEAWTVKRAERPGPNDPPPSECPDRIEVLSILGVEPGRSIGSYAEIHRDGDQRSVGEFRVHDSCPSEGRMVELLPDPTWPQPPEGTAEMIEAKLAKILGVEMHAIISPTTLH